VELRFHPTVEAYGRATGLPWWTAARTLGTRVDLLPLETLKGRGLLRSTLTHELVHVVADAQLVDRPLWVREGLAVAIAARVEDGAGQAAPAGQATPHTCPADADFRDPHSSDAWRKAYIAAGQCVAERLAAGVRWQDLGKTP
jgi:predicted small integral membrane protein